MTKEWWSATKPLVESRHKSVDAVVRARGEFKSRS